MASVTTATTGEVALSDIQEVFRCCGCGDAPMLPPVYVCGLGHAACATCGGFVHKKCCECGDSLNGRNLLLEEILIPALYNVPQDLILLDEDSKAEEEKNKIDELTGGAVTEASRRAAEHMANVVTWECHAQVLVSGRTMQCPAPCSALVTAPGLYRHFGFQHPEVLLVMPFKNRPLSLTIPYEYLDDLDQSSPTRCVYILVVGIGDEQLDEDNATELLSITHSIEHMLLRQRYLALLSISRRSEEVYALWVTAVYDFSPVKYTLRYGNGFTSVSYQGRPKSLHVPVDTRGGCLMLASALLSSDCHSKDLELSLTFHLDLPFHQKLACEVGPKEDTVPDLSEL